MVSAIHDERTTNIPELPWAVVEKVARDHAGLENPREHGISEETKAQVSATVKALEAWEGRQ